MDTKKLNKSVLVLSLVMTVLSFTNLLNLKVGEETLKLAGISVIVGIIAYFTTRKTNEIKTEGLDIKSIISSLKDIKIIVLILIPTVMNVLCFSVAKFCLPAYLEHLNSRTNFVDVSELIKSVLEVFVLALGEEIAWRAFFQKQTSKVMPFIPSLIITSILFSLGHFNPGNAIIVFYDLLFVFINAIFYGIVFKKTDNAWCSAVSHFIANLSGLFILNLFI
ncbi:MAG: CPBP family intramembrane metalloprotease [Clostridiales bacterium]|nr:CPBP family intramembrane metalloprotease [Clostridiales bacterium]